MPTEVPVPTDLSAPTADLALRGTAVLEQGLVPDALVLCAGERILWAGPAEHAPAELLPGGDRVLEHDGLILPGLVDLHCHGGGGASFPDSEDAEEMLAAVAATIGKTVVDVIALHAGVEHRVALVLVDMHGLPVAEAAQILDIPTGTVKSRCSRGREALGKILAAAGVGVDGTSGAAASSDTTGHQTDEGRRP